MMLYTTLSTIALLAYCLWRSHYHIALLQRSCNVERQRGDDWRGEAERKQALIDEYVELVDLMNDHNVALERRNLWLESRRYAILQRWWRRQCQYRPLVTSQVRRP